MSNDKYKSIFTRLTDSQFEDVLKECEFEYEKVDDEGGLFINGKQVHSSQLEEEYSKIDIRKMRKLNKVVN